MSAETFLVTGASGYLGRRVCDALLEIPGTRVVAWVHAADHDALERHRLALAAGPNADRRCVLGGDLTRDDAFEGVEAGSITGIVHAAAVTRFNVEEPLARAVNVEGTARLVAFAKSCPQLQSLVLVSSLYASGLRTGAIDEQVLDDGAGFANHYEWSKWSAELGLSRAERLPWRIVRVATVIADDAEGHVSQYNAVHNTLQLLCYGLLSTVPGRAETPVYVVTGAFAVEATVAVLRHGKDRAVYHAAHRAHQALPLGQLLETAWQAFGEDEGFRRRRLLPPLLVDEAAFGLLNQALGTFAGGVVNQALSSLSPFARQLFVPKDVRNGAMVSLLGRDPAPDPGALALATCRHLTRTKWGREVARAD